MWPVWKPHCGDFQSSPCRSLEECVLTVASKLSIHVEIGMVHRTEHHGISWHKIATSHLLVWSYRNVITARFKDSVICWSLVYYCLCCMCVCVCVMYFTLFTVFVVLCKHWKFPFGLQAVLYWWLSHIYVQLHLFCWLLYVSLLFCFFIFW